MAKQMFNEAERYVIQTYTDVRLLEDTAEAVRQKYLSEIRRIGAEVKERHPQLDFFDDQFKASWATGYMVFSRKKWVGDANYPSGLHFDHLRLEELSSPHADDPYGYVWLKPSRKAGANVSALRVRLWEELPARLTPQELAKCENTKDDDLPVRWPLAQKQEVLAWLTGNQLELLRERVLDQTDMFVKMLTLLDTFLTADKVTRPGRK